MLYIFKIIYDKKKTCCFLFEFLGNHLRNAIETQGNGAIKTTCMACSRPVPLDKIYEHKMVSAAHLDKLVKRLVDHYLLHSFDDYQLCPQPISVCSIHAIKCQDYPEHDVRCRCHTKWCYQCRNKDPSVAKSHFPLSCDNFYRWNSLGDDQTIAAGIKLTAKPCPNCHVSISRDLIEGCLHMTCTNCKTHFCWECLQSPYPHGNESGFFTCPEVEKKRQTEEGNAAYLRQIKEKQVAIWYNEAFELHCHFKQAAKLFSNQAKHFRDLLIQRIPSAGKEIMDTWGSPLIDLLTFGCTIRGKPVPGVIVFLRDAMEMIAFSVVHTYVSLCQM